ncbi:MAG: hypothetical protein Q9187_003700, partial [Circinaria calcarea]
MSRISITWATLLLLAIPRSCETAALPSLHVYIPAVRSVPVPMQLQSARDIGPLNDKTHLPIAIGSIFGAYILLTLAVITAIFTVGRRLRRSAQISPHTLAMEMFKPTTQPNVHGAFELDISPARSNAWSPSPASITASKRDWPSPTVGRSNKWGSFGRGHKQQTSVQSSEVKFDENVVQDDKAKNQIEMERLYAAVMEQDDQQYKSASTVSVKSSPQNPPELQHLRYVSQARQSSLPPTAEVDPNSPNRINTVSPQRTWTSNSKPTPVSIAGSRPSSRTSSLSSLGSFGRSHGIRSLNISPPMGSPDFAPDRMKMYGEAEPLSPRHYNPGPPPTPPQRHASNASDEQYQGSLASPRRKRFPSSIITSRGAVPSSRTPDLPSPRTPTRGPFDFSLGKSEIGESNEPVHQQASFQLPSRQLTPKSQRKPSPLPLQNSTNPTFEFSVATPETDDAISPSSQQTTHQDSLSQKMPRSLRKPNPLPLTVNTSSGLSPTSQVSMAGSNRTTPLPLRSINTNLSNRPISTIKATVLERRTPDVSNYLRTPATGVPATPYSPYMPFTPLTPVTP